MRFTLKNLRFLQYIDYQNVRKTEFLGCQSQESISQAPLSCFLARSTSTLSPITKISDSYSDFLVILFVRNCGRVSNHCRGFREGVGVCGMVGGRGII